MPGGASQGLRGALKYIEMSGAGDVEEHCGTPRGGSAHGPRPRRLRFQVLTPASVAEFGLKLLGGPYGRL